MPALVMTVGEVGVRLDADELAGLDRGSDGRPVSGPAVGTVLESNLCRARPQERGRLGGRGLFGYFFDLCSDEVLEPDLRVYTPKAAVLICCFGDLNLIEG
jgi:hypothetical protein